MKNRLSIFCLLGLLPMLVVSAATADQIESEASATLKSIAEVEVLSTTPSAQSADGLPTTEVHLRILAGLRGQLSAGDELVVRLPGGQRANGEHVTVLGTPRLEPGTRAVVALEQSDDGTWRASQALPSIPSPELQTKNHQDGPATMSSLGSKCLDVLGSNTADGTPVIYFQCTGNPNQDWTFVESFGFGEYELRGIGNKCLRPGSVGDSGFVEMEIGACGGTNALWQRAGNFPDNFRLVHRNTGQCLDVLGSNTADFTPIILFQCSGTSNQNWFFDVDTDTGSCVTTSTSLCLNNRFRVDISWRNFENVTGNGRVALSQGDSGIFWFFQSDNWEVMLKVLNGCGINQRYWVFFAATTSVQFSINVTDTATGQTETYFNPLGNSADAITDTQAFATCP